MNDSIKCKPHRFYNFDDDVGKWAVYEKVSPYFKDVEGCIKWSAVNRKINPQMTKRRNGND